jgi:lysophospholipase L1-like esterase
MKRKNRPAELSRGKRALFTCIAVVLMGLAVLAVAEVALRVFYPQTLNVYRYDPDYLFKFSPHSTIDYTSHEFSQVTTFNSRGFKDYEYDYEAKPENTFRAIVLGDSFTVGLEVPLEKTFVKQLEHKLRAQFPQKKIEVLSVATNGWSTEQQLLFLTKEGLSYQPDLVILAYYVGNDQIDNAQRNLFTYENDKLLVNTNRPLSQSSLRGMYYGLSSNFHLFNFVQSLYWKLREQTGTSSAVNYESAFVPYVQEELSPEVKAVWNKTFALLNAMRYQLGQQGIPLVIAVIPDRVQETPMRTEGIDLSHPQRLLKLYGKHAAVPVIDLLPAFRAHKNEQLHFEKDFHWNEKGHELAAEQLVQPTASFIN